MESSKQCLWKCKSSKQLCKRTNTYMWDEKRVSKKARENIHTKYLSEIDHETFKAKFGRLCWQHAVKQSYVYRVDTLLNAVLSHPDLPNMDRYAKSRVTSQSIVVAQSGIDAKCKVSILHRIYEHIHDMCYLLEYVRYIDCTMHVIDCKLLSECWELYRRIVPPYQNHSVSGISQTDLFPKSTEDVILSHFKLSQAVLADITAHVREYGLFGIYVFETQCYESDMFNHFVTFLLITRLAKIYNDEHKIMSLLRDGYIPDAICRIDTVKCLNAMKQIIRAKKSTHLAMSIADLPLEIANTALDIIHHSIEK